MSKRILWIAVIGLLGTMLSISGCKPESTDASKGEVGAEKNEDTKPQQKPLYDKEESEAIKKEILLKGELPPVMDVAISVKTVTGNLSSVDAERATLFAKPEIELCYRNALASDRDLTVTATMRVEMSGKGAIESVSLAPETGNEEFLTCVKSAGHHFKLPKTRDGEKGEVTYEISFKSKKGKTMEEVIEENREAEGGHEGHHH